MNDASTAGDRGHTDESVTKDEESDAHLLLPSEGNFMFPSEGNFSAVVPLSEVGDEPASPVNAHARRAAAESLIARAEARERARDDREEETLVPARAARRANASRPARVRASWAVMAAALTLSVAAGLAAGVYLVKTRRPVEIQATAVITEDGAREDAGVDKTADTQPTQVASEQRASEEVAPESSLNASPTSESKHIADVATPVSDAGERGENEGRGSSNQKRETASGAASGRGERANDASHAKALTAEREPERAARKAPPVTVSAPAQPKAVTARRANVGVESAPVLRAPKPPPVLSPPASAKSKKVIQWP
jgi:hypothetical protein